MFMKTHKCGSSSLQNIFLRFGDTHDLFFALPKIDNYFGHPIRFNRRFLLDPALLRKRYNLTYSMLAHHLRFNYKELAFVLPEDTIFITILRDPVRLFESLFVYYDYAANSLGSNVTLHDFALLFDQDPRFSAASAGEPANSDAASLGQKGSNDEPGHAPPSASSNETVNRLSEGGNREKTGQSVQSSSTGQSSRSGVKDQGSKNGWTWASLFNTILMGPMNGKAGGGSAAAGYEEEGEAGAANGQHDENNVSVAAAVDPDDKLTEDATPADDDNDGHYGVVTDVREERRRKNKAVTSSLSGKPGSFGENRVNTAAQPSPHLQRHHHQQQQQSNRMDPNFRVNGRFGRNQMCFDLGFNQKFFDSPKIVNNFIDAIDSMFHLVLIQERMSESLILLRHMLCWSMMDVVTFRHNSRADAFNPPPDLGLTEQSRQILVNLNRADQMMYDHFNAKFDSIVKAFGEERMRQEVNELEQLTNQLYSECVESTEVMNNIPGMGNHKESKLWQNRKAVGMVTRPNASRLCHQLTSSELSYTDSLRRKQQVFLRNNKKIFSSNFNSMHHILMNPPESDLYKHDRNHA